MTHKYHVGLESWWKVPLYRRHYIEIFVWETKEAMYAANEHFESIAHPGREVGRDFIGQARSSFYAIRFRGERRKIAIPKRFGEIYFVSGRISTLVATHELQHIMNYWIKNKEWDIDRFDERIATMAGELHRRFWNEFYKRYSV